LLRIYERVSRELKTANCRLAFRGADATNFIEFFGESVTKRALPTELIDERFGSFEVLLRYFAIGEHLAKTPLDLVFG
jgi:hypothetical protein